jgi:GTP-binding protein HflX
LRSELHQIERRKEQLVSSRHDHMTVSLVGYTNAGKSTLMNALTGAGVFAANKLFATLDTRTRRWQLPNWGPVLLSDTVGFIRDLPHHLIASFKATLEEARQADLLLHVADVSNPAVLDQISAVYEVLRELHIEEKDTLLALNKIDQLDSHGRLETVLRHYPSAVPVSAARGMGIEKLLWATSDALSRNFLDLDIETGVDNGRLMAYVAAHGEVLSRRFNETRVVIHCRLPQKHLGRVTEQGTVVRRHETNGNGVAPIAAPVAAAQLHPQS